MTEALEDVSRHLQQMEVVRVKSALWKDVIEKVIARYGVGVEIFEATESELRAELPKILEMTKDSTVGAGGIIQDALSEFHSEWKALLD